MTKKLFIAVAVFAGLLAAGCTKNEVLFTERAPSKKIDSSVWIDNLIDGKAAAKKENKKIFLFFSTEEDFVSGRLKEQLFDTPEFIEEAVKKFVLVNLDISVSKFEASKADPLASDEEKKASGLVERTLNEAIRNTTIYNTQGTPSFYVLSKEGYVITSVNFDQETISLEEWNKVMESKEEEIAVFENVIKSTESGKTEDRLKAIDRLFDITDPQLRFILGEKAQLYINLDKKNKTGACGAYVIAIANTKAMYRYLDNEPLAASEAFADCVKSKYLTPAQKQQAYYTAAYLLAESGAGDNEKIIGYFQSAYDADPSSEEAEAILSMINMMGGILPSGPLTAAEESSFDSAEEPAAEMVPAE